jgi:hypothetical protein
MPNETGASMQAGVQWQYLVSYLQYWMAVVRAGLDQELMDQIGRDLVAWVCVCVCVRAWNVAKVDR